MRYRIGSMALLLAGACGCAATGTASSGRDAVVRQLRDRPVRAEAVEVAAPDAGAAIPASGGPAAASQAVPARRYVFDDCRNGCIGVTLETGDDYRFTDDYIESIGKRIHLNLVFPWESVQRGPDGEVEVTLKIDRKGKLLSSEIARPSGNKTLDEAALASVGRSAPFSPFPPAPYVQSMKVRTLFRYSP